MDVWQSRVKGIIDGHVHMGGTADEAAIESVRATTGLEKMALVSIQNPKTGSGLAGSLHMKARYPQTYYVMAGLNHAARLYAGHVQTPSLAAQVDAFVKMGCDGLKMVDGKPTSRRVMDVPVTDAYFADYWARVEEAGLCVVWHVNDPEEFWDEARIPAWAKGRNWGYGPQDVSKEALYAEVDTVLARHPRLKVIFPHFYFLSADLARAARFLDAHPAVCLDLAPGIEFLYNLSHNVEASRAFFVRYAERIIFGTDLASRQTLTEARFRAGIVYRWLETEDAFGVPDGVDFLLGTSSDGVIRGMALPDDVLAKIYRGNWMRLVGAAPRPLNISATIEECERIAAIAGALKDVPAAPSAFGPEVLLGETDAARLARSLGQGNR